MAEDTVIQYIAKKLALKDRATIGNVLQQPNLISNVVITGSDMDIRLSLADDVIQIPESITLYVLNGMHTIKIVSDMIATIRIIQMDEIGGRLPKSVLHVIYKALMQPIDKVLS